MTMLGYQFLLLKVVLGLYAVISQGTSEFQSKLESIPERAVGPTIGVLGTLSDRFICLSGNAMSANRPLSVGRLSSSSSKVSCGGSERDWFECQ